MVSPALTNHVMYPINTPYQSYQTTHSFNTLYQPTFYPSHTLSIHPIAKPPTQPTLSTHPLNLPYQPSQPTLSTHLINPPYQPTLSTHPPYQPTPTTHPLNPPSQPTLLTLNPLHPPSQPILSTQLINHLMNTAGAAGDELKAYLRTRGTAPPGYNPSLVSTPPTPTPSLPLSMSLSISLYTH